MELALNIVCVGVTCGSFLAWILWRRRSDSILVPELGRGLLVVSLILMISLPAISITDDLALEPALAEALQRQDVLLKALEHSVEFVVAIILLLRFFSLGKGVLWREAEVSDRLLGYVFCWNVNIGKRPPPQVFV